MSLRIFTAESFGIRQFQIGDVSQLYEAARESTSQVYPWLEWCHPNYSMEDASDWVTKCKELWDTGEAYPFAIVDVNSDLLMGGVGLNRIDRVYKHANLGYWVRTSCTTRGAATEATQLIAKFGFEELGLIRIDIVASIKNIASQRVAEKVGAQKEGILRKFLILHGEVHDAVGYSLVLEDFGLAESTG